MKTLGWGLLMIARIHGPVVAWGETWETVYETDGGMRIAVDVDNMQLDGPIVRYWEQ